MYNKKVIVRKNIILRVFNRLRLMQQHIVRLRAALTNSGSNEFETSCLILTFETATAIFTLAINRNDNAIAINWRRICYTRKSIFAYAQKC
ncbi:hypothetical protein PUN28_004793 [Cardiocondyla obscurior]|uniref:Uncharacterized protein n=1 Tax=Cardiocondyla obscurior TaxID=286306 RepID=A0AAW2GIP3_9HYME